MPLYNPSVYAGPEKVKYLFIDGGSLNSLLEVLSKNFFGDMEIEIDYNRLAAGYQKIFYYDCLPAQKTGESDTDYQTRIKPKNQLFNHLKSLDRFHVYEGTARYRDKRKKQEQKEVDIMIAVDMLTHSFRKNMHEATLLTGDLDFKPLIDALVQDGMYVSLWYPKGRANYELVDAADSRQALMIRTIHGWSTDSFREKFRLPILNQTRAASTISFNWKLLEKIEKSTYKSHFYITQEGYAAVVPTTNGYEDIYQYDNLDQLKFYVDHLYAPDVLRQDLV